MSSMNNSQYSRQRRGRKISPYLMLDGSNDLDLGGGLMARNTSYDSQGLMVFTTQSKENQNRSSMVQEVVDAPPNLGLMNPSTDLNAHSQRASGKIQG